MRRLSPLCSPRVRTESVDISNKGRRGWMVLLMLWWYPSFQQAGNDRLLLCFIWMVTVGKTQGNRFKHGKRHMITWPASISPSAFVSPSLTRILFCVSLIRSSDASCREGEDRLQKPGWSVFSDRDVDRHCSLPFVLCALSWLLNTRNLPLSHSFCEAVWWCCSQICVCVCVYILAPPPLLLSSLNLCTLHYFAQIGADVGLFSLRWLSCKQREKNPPTQLETFFFLTNQKGGWFSMNQPTI